MATIETRRSADGTTGYRAKVRLKGFPSQSATFERKTDAKEWEWIHENPMRKISKLSEPRGRVRFLDDEERERLLEACKTLTNPSLHTLVVLALSTGGRYGELIKLRWDDIDWGRKVITLHDTKNKERRLLSLMHYALELMEVHHKTRNINSDLVFLPLLTS